VFGVAVTGSTLGAATTNGLSISTDGGSTWANYTTADGMGSHYVYGVTTSGSKVDAATQGGVSIRQ